jgi:hypothetical protein
MNLNALAMTIGPIIFTWPQIGENKKTDLLLALLNIDHVINNYALKFKLMYALNVFIYFRTTGLTSMLICRDRSNLLALRVHWHQLETISRELLLDRLGWVQFIKHWFNQLRETVRNSWWIRTNLATCIERHRLLWNKKFDIDLKLKPKL